MPLVLKSTDSSQVKDMYITTKIPIRPSCTMIGNKCARYLQIIRNEKKSAQQFKAQYKIKCHLGALTNRNDWYTENFGTSILVGWNCCAVSIQLYMQMTQEYECEDLFKYNIADSIFLNFLEVWS